MLTPQTWMAGLSCARHSLGTICGPGSLASLVPKSAIREVLANQPFTLECKLQPPPKSLLSSGQKSTHGIKEQKYNSNCPKQQRRLLESSQNPKFKPGCT